MTATSTLLPDTSPAPGEGWTVPAPPAAPDEVTDLARRVTGALAVGGDRLDPVSSARARTVMGRIGERALLGAGHTVVALAGPTGSGKSSLFNAIAGFDVSPVGVRRPTTGDPVACVWGPGSADLLDWLEVPTRYRTERVSELEAGDAGPLQGLVLLDMPDHDSRQRRHRRLVDRLVERVDLLVWVVDPQKYADAVLHSDYLQRMVHHEDVVVVLLNQADTLPADSVGEVRDDLCRLLAEDGLPRVDVLVTSAVTGAGLGEVAALLQDAVASRAVVSARARADLLATIDALRTGVGQDEAQVEAGGAESRVVRALAEAAGVPVVVDAVEASYRRRAGRWTGWPPVRWTSRIRRDPLERLRLSSKPGAPLADALAVDTPVLDLASLPQAGATGQARVERAVSEIVERAADGLPPRWAASVRSATPTAAQLRDALDRAISQVDITFRDRRWWRVAGALHTLLLFAGASGLLALVALAGLQFLQFSDVEVPTVLRIPLPTLLLFVGLLGGPLLAGALSGVVDNRARAQRTSAETTLLVAVTGVARATVVDPVATVLTDHRHCRDLLTL